MSFVQHDSCISLAEICHLNDLLSRLFNKIPVLFKFSSDFISDFLVSFIKERKCPFRGSVNTYIRQFSNNVMDQMHKKSKLNEAIHNFSWGKHPFNYHHDVANQYAD